MESISNFFETMTPAEKAIIGSVGVLILIAIAIYVIQLFRRANSSEPSDHWTSFREMRENGTIREYEYKHLRKKMAEKRVTKEKSGNEKEADGKPGESENPDFSE